MPPCVRDGTTSWGRLHRTLGLLISDPRAPHRLADEKVRCSIVAAKRLATLVQSLVRANLVPSHLETWGSHQVADGTWCPGKAKPTAAATVMPSVPLETTRRATHVCTTPW